MTSHRTGSSINIEINGGAPLGFRLVQGAEDGLVVDKVRRNGKAEEAGLKEGDALVSVNGQSCQGLSSPGALSLIDSSGQKLTLNVTRYSHDDLTSSEKDPKAQTRLSAPQTQTNRNAPNKSDHVTPSSDLPPWSQQMSFRTGAPPFQTTTSSSRTVTVSAPEGVQVERNTDESFTMTIGFPFSMPLTLGTPAQDLKTSFSVKSVVTSEQQMAPVTWQAKPSTVENKNKKPPPVINPVTARILPDLTDSDTPNTPGTPGATGRSKKLFIDSAFYDDPEHKYPTFEEQVSLARQVAMSVLAPANTNSRGHKMFIRCKERAIKYTTGPKEQEQDMDPSMMDPSDEDSWKKQSDPRSPTEQGPGGLPKSVMFAPKLPTEKTDDRLNAMSSEELERLRLSERKTTHTNVSPQVCFSLADDLRNMKGKGGKLFAKRQAKSESWNVEEGGGNPTSGQEEEETEANPEVLEKLRAGHKKDASMKVGVETTAAAMPVNRLAEMINIPKAAMTPWESAARFGNVEKAFSHLDDSSLQNRSKQLAGNLEMSLQKRNRPMSTIVTRDFGGVGGAGSGIEGSRQTPTQDDKVKLIGGNMDAAGLARIMTSSLNKSGNASATGFRQLKFKPPETTSPSAETTTSDLTSSSAAVGNDAPDATRTSQMSVRLLQA